MPWVRIDDRILDHPKCAALSDAALALWFRGLVYSARQLTDGRIAPSVVARLGTRAAARELAHAKLWTPARDRGYLIHDYLRYQPSRTEVLALRAVRAEAGRAGGLARASVSKADSNLLSKSAENASNLLSKSAENDKQFATPRKPGTPVCPTRDPVLQAQYVQVHIPQIKEERGERENEASLRARLDALKKGLEKSPLPIWPGAKSRTRR